MYAFEKSGSLSRRRFALLGVTAGAMIWIAGCSGGDGPVRGDVSGTVTIQGAPIADATVMFVPEKGPVAAGTTDGEGKFTVVPGVPVGRSKVMIHVSVPGENKPTEVPSSLEDIAKASRQRYESRQKGGDKANEPKSLVPEKYRDAKTTPLSFEVKEGDNVFAIELT